MEGLTITPDGKTLVGVMQSALTQNDVSKPKNVAVTRIVTINLKTRATHEYAFVQVDLAQATDVGPRSTVGSYDGADGGVRVDGKSVEAIAGTGDESSATAALLAAGITPVSQKLYLDLGALVSSVKAEGTLYDHDKIEGVAILNGGHTVVISNDSDFGISDSTGDAAPFGLVAKTAPDGSIDRGEFLVINRN